MSSSHLSRRLHHRERSHPKLPLPRLKEKRAVMRRIKERTGKVTVPKISGGNNH